jgi:hypothetical protein
MRLFETDVPNMEFMARRSLQADWSGYDSGGESAAVGKYPLEAGKGKIVDKTHLLH